MRIEALMMGMPRWVRSMDVQRIWRDCVSGKSESSVVDLKSIVKRTASAIEQHSANMTKPSSRPRCFAMAKREMLLRATPSAERADSTIETVTRATSPLMPGASDCLVGDGGLRRALVLWSHRRSHGVRGGRHTLVQEGRMHNPSERQRRRVLREYR